MVLPPGEVFDHRGMFSMLVCFLFRLLFEDIIPYVYDIDVDTICCCCFVHV
jgi:hypothetical protein